MSLESVQIARPNSVDIKRKAHFRAHNSTVLRFCAQCTKFSASEAFDDPWPLGQRISFRIHWFPWFIKSKREQVQLWYCFSGLTLVLKVRNTTRAFAHTVVLLTSCALRTTCILGFLVQVSLSLNHLTNTSSVIHRCRTYPEIWNGSCWTMADKPGKVSSPDVPSVGPDALRGSSVLIVCAQENPFALSTNPALSLISCRVYTAKSTME